MDSQLKIAQMNTRAVVDKLIEYEKRHAAQEKRITEIEAKVSQLQQQFLQLQLQVVTAQVNNFGGGPTVG
jgi:uncharacterized coiled-coil protein SlyX